MIDDREMVIKFRQVYVEEELSHWETTIEFDGEQVYQETATDMFSAGTKIYQHVWEDNSTIPNTYRYKKLENPFTPPLQEEEEEDG